MSWALERYLGATTPGSTPLRPRVALDAVATLIARGPPRAPLRTAVCADGAHPVVFAWAHDDSTQQGTGINGAVLSTALTLRDGDVTFGLPAFAATEPDFAGLSVGTTLIPAEGPLSYSH